MGDIIVIRTNVPKYKTIAEAEVLQKELKCKGFSTEIKSYTFSTAVIYSPKTTTTTANPPAVTTTQKILCNANNINKTTLTLYLSPVGNDNSDGSIGSPIKTLAYAQKLLKCYDDNKQNNPFGNIIIKINPGKYIGQSVIWSYVNPGYSITFEPTYKTDANGQIVVDRPVFEGTAGNADTWFTLTYKGITGNRESKLYFKI